MSNKILVYGYPMTDLEVMNEFRRPLDDIVAKYNDGKYVNLYYLSNEQKASFDESFIKGGDENFVCVRGYPLVELKELELNPIDQYDLQIKLGHSKTYLPNNDCHLVVIDDDLQIYSQPDTTGKEVDDVPPLYDMIEGVDV